MKIALLLNEFPTLSKTFMLNQITGLTNRGHEVDIYADRPGNTEKIHPDVGKCGLLSCTYYIGRLYNRFERVLFNRLEMGQRVHDIEKIDGESLVTSAEEFLRTLPKIKQTLSKEAEKERQRALQPSVLVKQAFEQWQTLQVK